MHALAVACSVVSLVVAAAAGQAAAPAAPPREQFAALLLGTAPWPERIEVRGKILVVQDFVVAAKDAGAGDELARRVLDGLLLAILTEELQHGKAWLADDANEAAYAAYAEQYDKTPFTVKVLATRFKGFADLETFQRRWRVVHAFAKANKLLEPTEADLVAEAKASNDFLTDVTVQAEIWLHEAPRGADGRRDFAAAEQQARATLEALARGGDAPKLADGVQYLRPGKGPVGRNLLRQTLGEGEYTALHQVPVGDIVFAAEEGKLIGPLRGTTGCCIARVERRTPSKRAVDIGKPATRAILGQLLEERRFLAWVDEVLAGLRIDGRTLASKN